ncbi:hypothetical protein CCACVL1_03648 [Corchorus capsularis]|uniref:Uncharacterized protein n=1 Tax=Corchorus capsularis TaxID=210143 RepID=A0A1R3JY20_COCAP|nr:hypothetical protein CCACVL1_03648 [Corchorus capsularis]
MVRNSDFIIEIAGRGNKKGNRAPRSRYNVAIKCATITPDLKKGGKEPT